MKKIKLNIPLIIAAVIIYGLITYKVIAYINTNDEEETIMIDNDANIISKKKSSTFIEKNEFKFETLENDPFTFREKKPEVKTVVKPVVKQRELFYEPPLQFKINGVIINNERKTVVLEDLAENKTVFLHEGEEYSTIKINSISKNKIEVTERGMKREIEVR